MTHVAFRVLFIALINTKLSRVFTVKLEINTLFTPKATHSVAILMILSATRSLLTSKFMMSCSFRLKLDTYNDGNVLMLHQQEATTAVSIVKVH